MKISVHGNSTIASRCVGFVATSLLAACGGSGGPGSDNGGGQNRAPVISGSPATSAVVDEPYSFTPNATDADGDALTFSAQNLPGWTDFNSATGTISGTPAMADIGMYADIAVTVSDGRASASLPRFGIDVTQIGTASATLSWTAPTRNNDGTTLTDLAGYIIYYGTSSRNYSNQIQINNSGLTTYVVEGLAAGTYYFAAKAVNTAGAESDFSSEASATLTGT